MSVVQNVPIVVCIQLVKGPTSQNPSESEEIASKPWKLYIVSSEHKSVCCMLCCKRHGNMKIDTTCGRVVILKNTYDTSVQKQKYVSDTTRLHIKNVRAT